MRLSRCALPRAARSRYNTRSFRMRQRITSLCALLLVLWLCSPMPARAQRRRDLPGLAAAPPPVVPQSITVAPGQSVQIPLTIIGGRGEQLEFLIRVPPRAGKLSAVRLVGANVAAVTYRAPVRGGEDRFSYAVRSSEGVSAAALVSITITDAPALPMAAAKLLVPESVEFPAVFPGELATAELEVQNIGTSIAEGSLTLPPQWSSETNPRYRIGVGGRMVFKLTFTQTKVGVFQDDAVFGPSPKRIVPLHATVEAPLLVKPAALKLAAAPGQAARTAMFLLENRTEEQQTVTLRAGPHLIVSAEIKVEAKETTQVAVTASAGQPAEFADKLKLQCGTWNAELPVRVVALGAMVKFRKPPEFGAVVARTTARAELVLENVGAQAATVTLRADGAFSVESEKLTVPPRAEARTGVTLREPKAGVNSGKLTAEWDGAREEIALSVIAVERAKPVPKPVVPTVQAEEPETEADGLAVPRAKAEHPNGLGEFAREILPTSAVLEWPAHLGEKSGAVRVEERFLSLGGDEELVVNWRPLSAVTFSEAGENRRAVLRGLKPDSLTTLRVVSGAGDTVFTAQFFTAPSKPWIDIGWQSAVLSALGAAIVGIGWYRWKTRVRSSW